MKTLTMIAVAAAAVFVGGGAQASTVTFDSIASGGTASYSEGGFFFQPLSGAADGVFSWGPGSSFTADPSPSSATIVANYVADSIVMTATGGLHFGLTSIDLADAYNAGTVDDIAFHFVFGNGSTLDTLRTLDATPGLETFAFGLADLVSAEWKSNSGGFGPQADNIVVAVAATPIPAALPLFASALGGLGFVGWRKRKSASAAA